MPTKLIEWGPAHLRETDESHPFDDSDRPDDN